jgi:hypothetical protein
MLEIAQTQKLIGSTEDKVYKIYGNPKNIRTGFSGTVTEGGTCCDGPYKNKTDYQTWTYSVTPYYLLSRTFEVSFTDGSVDNYREVIYELW